MWQCAQASLFHTTWTGPSGRRWPSRTCQATVATTAVNPMTTAAVARIIQWGGASAPPALRRRALAALRAAGGAEAPPHCPLLMAGRVMALSVAIGVLGGRGLVS